MWSSVALPWMKRRRAFQPPLVVSQRLMKRMPRASSRLTSQAAG
jgi:hypothetical protein